MFFDAKRLEDVLERRKADGFLALTPPNVFYLTGFGKSGGTGAVLRGSQASRPRLVVPSGDVDFVIEGVPEQVDVVAYGWFVRAFSEEESWGADERRIADLHRVARTEASLSSTLASVLEGFRGTLLCDVGLADPALADIPEGVVVRSDPRAFKTLRTVKTREEIRRLKDAAEITEAAIDEVASSCKEGATQADLARAFCSTVARSGAGLRLAHISIGRDGAFGNANVAETRLLVGDAVKLDVGVVSRGYASDMARCFVFGEPSEKARTYYEALLRGQDVVLEATRPGVPAAQIFDRAVDAVRSSGIPHYDRTNVGHGIGVAGDGYDPPLLSRTDDTRLEPGMVLCAETPYYEIGFGGLQVEDMVVVTGDGYERLTESSRELRVVG